MNTDYTDNLIAKVNAIPTCDDIKDKVGEARDEIIQKIKDSLSEIEFESSEYFAGLTARITAALAVLEPLSQIPTDLQELLEWIPNFITETILNPVNAMILDLAQIPIEAARVSDAIASKIAALSSCVLDI